MTIAAATMADTSAGRPSPTRAVGVLAIATGIAAFGLLAFHPGGNATDFAGVLKEEAANRAMDAAVHGGFIVVLALQAVVYAVFCDRLGWQRPSTLAGFVFFCAGTAFLAASMLLDGLVTPALAARYVAKPDKIESARTLFVLIGTLIGLLMPVGLAFQSAAIAAWGWALTGAGHRVTGLFGLAVGIATLAAVGFASMNPLVLMGAIAGSALWAAAVGIGMVRGHG